MGKMGISLYASAILFIRGVDFEGKKERERERDRERERERGVRDKFEKIECLIVHDYYR